MSARQRKETLLDEPTGANAPDAMNLLDRIAHIEDERAALQEDIKTIWAEAKAGGHNVPALRRAHAIRKLEHEDRIALGEYVEAFDLFG